MLFDDQAAPIIRTRVSKRSEHPVEAPRLVCALLELELARPASASRTARNPVPIFAAAAARVRLRRRRATRRRSPSFLRLCSMAKGGAAWMVLRLDML